jgi:FkbM family methyltransferase
MRTNKDDQPFRHYTLRQQLIRWVSSSLFDNLTYTVRRGLLKGMRRQGGLGWIPQFGPHAIETPEHRFLGNLDLSNKVVFDVGAFEGLITLFFARRARQVVCYEPNSRNRARLCRNLELNEIRNVTVRKTGLGAKPTAATMAWNPGTPGGATLSTDISRAIGRRADARQEEIQVTTLDQDLAEAHLPEPDFIKVDVEGYELPVLEGARRLLEAKHPALYLEIHGETIQDKRSNVRAIVAYLAKIGYENLLHIESGQEITRQNCDRACQGHLYVLAVS